MTPVRFSPKAESDLEQIGDYIVRDSPRRAVSFIDELRETCARIGHAPEAFQLQPTIGATIRRAVHRRYSVFYTVHPREVRIERILHGARDVTANEFEG
jgi:toxin ParE1/3/4